MNTKNRRMTGLQMRRTMMTLYDINQSRLEFFERIASGEIPEEAIPDTLASMDGEFDDKADNIACFIKSLLYDAQAIKSEADTLILRAFSKTHKAEKLTDHLFGELKFAGKSKIETARNILQIKSNPLSVQIANPERFIAWAKENNDSLLTYKEPAPDKKAIKTALQDGIKIPNVELVHAEKLTIK